MKRDQVINSLIKKNKYKRYLEIGIGDGTNFKNIICDYKTNVDPFLDTLSGQGSTLPINKMTSDEFFKTTTEKFDIIFVDGLHTFEQTLKDIINSFNHLNSEGIVVCHDMLPPTEWHQRDSNEPDGGEWNGTCWKAIAYLRTTDPTIDIKTIDTDWGISLLKKGNTNLFDKNFYDIDYNFFSLNRNELMNVITVNDFVNTYL